MAVIQKIKENPIIEHYFLFIEFLQFFAPL